MNLRGRTLLCAVAAATVLLASATPAPGAVGDPTFTMGGFDNPCGVSVDGAGNFYVSSYYENSISIFKSNQEFVKTIASVDPAGGPCATAQDTGSNLYVNNFHHDVVKLHPDSTPIIGTTNFFVESVFHSDEPTGVGVDVGLSRVYVNARTHVAAYSTLGAPQLEFGEGVIGDGYGLAVSQFPTTSGLVYVADAATETVKAFNQSGLLISSFGGPAGPFPGFNSLRDAAIAVSKASGHIYVSDRVGPEFSERPESVIYIFDSTGTYVGRLKFNVIDGRPVGLAVDNTAGANQGRVYVTTGAAGGGSVYAYPPGSAVLTGFPAEPNLLVASVGAGGGSITSSAAGIDCAGTCSKRLIGGAETELRAHPDPGSTFVGWSGASCSGTDTCVVRMDGSQSVSAAFAPLSSTPVVPLASWSSSATMSAPGSMPAQAQGRRHAKKHQRRAQRHRSSKRHRRAQRR